MKKLLLSAALLLGTAALFAQTKSERDLEAAVRIYNALRNFTANLSAATVTDADVASAIKSVGDGLALLDPIIKNEKGEIAGVARYFRTNFLYEHGHVLGLKGRSAESFDLMRSIDADMNGYTSARFPLEYAFEGRNYVVKWENFAPTLAEFNTAMAGFFFAQKDFVNALAYANKANENAAFLSDLLKVTNNNRIVQIKTERREYDQIALNAALTTIETYHDLNAESRTAGGTGLAQTLDAAAALLDQTLAANPALLDNGDPYARAARVVRAEGRAVQYRDFAAKAIRAGYRDRTFLNDALADAATANDRVLGLLAADRLAGQLAPDDCPGMSKLADQYERFGERAKAADWRKRADACTSSRRTAEVRARRDFGLYLGGYVIPLFRRDWGVVAGILTRKVYIEASYQREIDNRDRLHDLRLRGVDGARDEKVFWDGYYAHLAVNGNGKTGRRGLRPYSGFLLGYNVREYETIQTDVYDRGTDVSQGRAAFDPVEKRYILMLNAGVHSYGRWLAANLFLSAGASYNVFERGNATYENSDNFRYDNVLLEKRRDGRAAFMARIGLTIGFQFGTNNVKR